MDNSLYCVLCRIDKTQTSSMSFCSRFLSSSSAAVDGTHTYDEHNDPAPLHSPISSTASTLTGSEDSPPTHCLLARSTQHSSQTQVITPIYSLSSEPSRVSGGLKISSPRVVGCLEKSQHRVNRSHKLGSLRQQDGVKTGLPHTPLASQQGHPVPNNLHHFPLKSSPSHSSVDIKSTVTTSSEIDFRNNLASLDADIARLQMQFKVARQSHTEPIIPV